MAQRQSHSKTLQQTQDSGRAAVLSGSKAVLGLPSAGDRNAALGEGRKLGQQPYRPVHPGSARGRRTPASTSGLAPCMAPTSHLRRHRPAPDSRRNREFPGRHFHRSTLTSHRPVAGQPCLWRAVGPTLAGRRPLRRLERARRKSLLRQRLPLPRLCRRRFQCGPALRPVHQGTAGRGSDDR